ncbi:type IVB secretion system coupling complex protein DotM/IcmP [Coxiella burnetii]|uniref:type IVB secretion system coupling complex protein DotM/IcmP n=1 Tax=Coxiella burnetii TaxID=777 RepID=UPI000163A4DB|nr:type IVB secretion system coupling complex protein DotM/IcmP [Coxiella burnetii]AIT64055.1 IcmP [Coxiella burnetii str. Namibia]ATN86545.1 phosphoesterase [Coxiella burnetii str. Schperling]EDR35485.1 IcmP protein [Coxiella burnetii Q321]PHH56982.1 phosphoesterase [Coxiella burnetii]
MYPAQQNATDQTANFFWLLVLLTLGVLVFWWLERSYIVSAIFFVRHYEIDLIKGVLDGVNVGLGWLNLTPIDDHKLAFWQHFMATANKKEVTFPQVGALSTDVGLWVRYPVILILLGLASWMLFRNRSARFQRTHTMDSLKKSEVENWPQITPVLSLNLLKTDLDKGPWAMAKLPLNFCKEHNLLDITIGENDKKVWTVKPGPAERLFVLQMGPLWKGVEALPIHVKALLIVFVARGHRDHKVAEDLLVQIAQSALHGRLNFSGVEELLTKYKDSKIIKWLESRHAYVGTLMASLLEIARIEGVLATAEFLWLKPVDRRLWYMLNSVGRQTAVVEVAGLFAHWRAEKRLERPLRTPMVKEAVTALEKDITTVLYISEEERWHTSRAA